MQQLLLIIVLLLYAHRNTTHIHIRYYKLLLLNNKNNCQQCNGFATTSHAHKAHLRLECPALQANLKACGSTRQITKTGRGGVVSKTMYQDYLDEVLEVNEKIEKKLKLNEPIGELLKQSEECLKSLSVESRKLPGKERRLAAQDIKNLKMKVESIKDKNFLETKRVRRSWVKLETI